MQRIACERVLPNLQTRFIRHANAFLVLIAFVHVNTFANSFALACERVCLRVRTRLAWRANARALYVASVQYCNRDWKRSPDINSNTYKCCETLRVRSKMTFFGLFLAFATCFLTNFRHFKNTLTAF